MHFCQISEQSPADGPNRQPSRDLSLFHNALGRSGDIADSRTDARHPVLTVFLQLCALHICPQNDLILADPAHQAVFFDRQNDPPSGLVFSLHAITPLLRLCKSHVEFDSRIILLYN